ncbi:LysR family transcriptional regulator [Haliangium ochraceum]|uniref:Transcriptional regulator, LysR family n=1 Tax=Haliangium ochraceum (strain DSM 14365 / JCM 11303 / SMP-2) TaxID=502025 RepID=D0LNV8_HALO1|nr:LysR family transcriptional regulator [Haliangium ochraceum]ACY18784.1 transcriptional regulator, LysR family [Haliangium ochraceum DSM 14365]
MRSKLATIEIFCLAYELGTFTAAARELGLSPQSASRALARLEGELGVVLFRRNTRHIQATEAGRTYYETCRSVLKALDAVEMELPGGADEPSGDVRVSVPTTYGHHRFLPLLAEFRRRHPRVFVDVQVDNRTIDFVRDRFDVAIRMGKLHDAPFIARKLGDFSLGLFASPAYLRARGEPRSLDDIDNHECVLFVMPRTGKILPWSLAGEPRSYTPRAAIRVRHDVLGLISIARAGGGIIQIYDYLVENELARGELVEILPDYRGRSRPFSLIYPPEAMRRPPVRALVEFVVHSAAGDLGGPGFSDKGANQRRPRGKR